MKASIFACVILIFHYAAGEGDGPEYACEDDTDMYGEDGLPTHRPLIIAHRGSSGMFPEHSALAYRMAAEQGADVIECDLALTKDLHFVCMHEPWLNRTTDVADHPEFGHLLTTYEINDDDETLDCKNRTKLPREFDWNDKGNITSWFTFDMTLAELKTLKLKQPEVFRDPRYDWQESIPTLEELVEITREYAEKQNRVIGIYPEMKHAFAINKIFEFKSKGEPFTRFEDVALDTLQRLGFTSEKDPCFLQSFEFCSLEYVRNKTDLKLVLLLEQNLTDANWERIDKLNLAGIGLDKGGLVALGEPDDIGRGQYQTGVTNFLDQVHDHGLKAHAFTFRNEWMKLYWDHGQDPYSQLKQFYDLGLDGYFTDFPLTVRRFLHYENVLCLSSGASCSIPGMPYVVFTVIFFLSSIL